MKYLITVVVLILIIGGGWLYFDQSNNSSNSGSQSFSFTASATAAGIVITLHGPNKDYPVATYKGSCTAYGEGARSAYPNEKASIVCTNGGAMIKEWSVFQDGNTFVLKTIDADGGDTRVPTESDFIIVTNL